MSRLIWSPAALLDIKRLFDFLKSKDLNAAKRAMPRPQVSAENLRAVRDAHYLRTNPRTLENWEQGRARPNAQAALLIHLVDRYPDTAARLASV